MTRIPPITSKNQIAPEAYASFDSIAASRGNVRGPFAMLMHSPELAGRAAHLGAFVRFESSLPAHLREITVATVARECECAYEWAAHASALKEAGIAESTIDVIRTKAPVDGLGPDEQKVVRYARELVREHRVSDETFAPVHALLGDTGITELTAAVGYYSFLACVLNAFEVPAPDGSTRIA